MNPLPPIRAIACDRAEASGSSGRGNGMRSMMTSWHDEPGTSTPCHRVSVPDSQQKPCAASRATWPVRTTPRGGSSGRGFSGISIALEASDQLPGRRAGDRGGAAAARAAARQGVQVAANQDEGAVGQQLAEGALDAGSLKSGNAEDADDLVGPRWMGEPFPEAGQQFGVRH